MTQLPEEQLERELRVALGREDPPAGFAEKVIRRAEQMERPWARWGFWGRWFAAPLVRRAAVGALCVAAAVGYESHRQEQRRAAGEEAKRKVMLALRITGAKMRHAESRVRKIGHDD